MNATFSIPECPDDLTRVIDRYGSEWTREITRPEAHDKWQSKRGDTAIWGTLVGNLGPLTRAPEPPVTIPAERWDANKVADLLRFKHPMECDVAIGIARDVLNYLNGGTS
jgi:hypothetical protein